MKRLDRWLARAARWAAGLGDVLAGPRIAVLIFHRVLPRTDPLFPGEMTAERFERLMALVAAAFNVMTLGHAMALRAAGKLPRRALVITFDDGYADNAEIALPILQRHGLRATIFVSTGFLDGGRMWNDSVIETVRAAKVPALDLASFGLGTLPLATAQQRSLAIDALLPKLKYMTLAEREEALSRLHRLAGAPGLPGDLMMTSGQVREMHRAGMEVGGHTVNHPILRVLPDEQARAEIDQGRQHLQSIIDAPVEVFAYPNGRPAQDFDQRHVDMMRQMGFAAAVSTAPGVVTAGSDRYQLPRFTPWQTATTRWLIALLQARYRGAVRA
jgi:peptidoglycan/xylan/chitin deacetylase (PgdA/CDA1 family)